MNLEPQSWNTVRSTTVDGTLVDGGSLHIRTSGGRIATSDLPSDWSAFGEISFDLRTVSPVNFRLVLGDARSSAWRRVRIAAATDSRIRLPLCWFPWSDAGSPPSFRAIAELALEFTGTAEVWLSDLELTPGTPFLTAADVAEELPVHDLSSVALVSDIPDLDLAAFDAHFAKVRTAIAADFGTGHDSRPIFVLRQSREAWVADVERFTGHLGANLGSPPSGDGFTLKGVAFSAGRALRPVHTHEYAHALLANTVRLPGHGDWLQEGAAVRYQLRFHPQANVGDLVRVGLSDANRRLPLARLCDGRAIDAMWHWQAMTVVEMLVAKGQLRGVVDTVLRTGSADLQAATGRAWLDLEAEWLAFLQASASELWPSRTRPRSSMRGMKREFGQFLIPEALGQAMMIRRLVEVARVNPNKPAAEASVRLAGLGGMQLGYELNGESIVYVDVANGRLEFTEVWGGVVTARKYKPLGKV